jgi:UDP-N-acetylmuramyl pentapeptide phosphotransferase/UDP-N-acetylglucosamine-1-phosphate transferase
MENEDIMVIVVLFPLLLFVCAKIFIKSGWKVTNYLGRETPYSLGLCVFIAICYVTFQVTSKITTFAILYLFVLWLSGFIDDRFGSKYPKGLKGHILLFVNTGRISTGLVKLSSTIIAALVYITYIVNGTYIDRIVAFFILIMSPHVMNLFDTRPLRVWKVLALHSVMFIPFLWQVSFGLLASIFFMIASIIYFEGNRIGMLGDNGATLLGGVVSIFAIYNLQLSLQLLLLGIYISVIVFTERFSISALIEKSPFLKRIDRWGVS